MMMPLTVAASSLWILVTYYWVLFSRCVQVQACPYVTSCCECTRTPGCSWYDSPHLAQPHCSESPFLIGDQHSSRHSGHVRPNVLYTTTIRPARNRPINQARRRLFRPQAAHMSLALGGRHELLFQVLSPSGRLQLLVKGPNDSPQFTLEQADTSSCVDGFTSRNQSMRGAGRRRGMRDRNREDARRRVQDGERTRPREARRRGRGGGRGNGRRTNGKTRASMQRQHYECVGSAPNLIHSFRLIVDMNQCLPASRFITVGVRGATATKRLKVKVTSECSCPCEGNMEVVAGGQEDQCKNDQRHCNTTDTDVTCTNVNSQCKESPSSLTCSGRGSCFCGQCICHSTSQENGTSAHASSNPSRRFTGRFCECDDTSCPFHDGMICGGVTRGVCSCGICTCHEDYMGEACEINVQTDVCRDPLSPQGLVCNGHGECVTGQCQCHHQFSGPYCHDCPTCPSHCQSLRSCVECLLFGATDADRINSCEATCTRNPRVQHMAVTQLSDQQTDNLQQCMYTSPDRQCYYHFSYDYQQQGTLRVYYATQLECAAPDENRRYS